VRQPSLKSRAHKPGNPHDNGTTARAKFSVPVSFEANMGQAEARAEFVGRGGGATVLLTSSGLEFAGGRRGFKAGGAGGVAMKVFSTRLGQGSASKMAWHGLERSTGETNYFLGYDPAR
jgi:hypothetical protein